jgi:hypothetical protein
MKNSFCQVIWLPGVGIHLILQLEIFGTDRGVMVIKAVRFNVLILVMSQILILRRARIIVCAFIAAYNPIKPMKTSFRWILESLFPFLKNNV